MTHLPLSARQARDKTVALLEAVAFRRPPSDWTPIRISFPAACGNAW